MNEEKNTIEHIRNDWFKNHTIKSIEGSDSLRRIVWGEEGTGLYQIEYVFSDNKVFVSGDLGYAVYSLTCTANLENINGFNLGYFTSKLEASSKDVYKINPVVAAEEIQEVFLDYHSFDNIEELSVDDYELYLDLVEATHMWHRTEDYKIAVFHIYDRVQSDWFDSEVASSISECGKELSPAFISYWIGLQMISEQLKSKN